MTALLLCLLAIPLVLIAYGFLCSYRLSREADQAHADLKRLLHRCNGCPVCAELAKYERRAKP